MTILEQAQTIRSAMDIMAENVSDYIASTTAIAFPRLEENGKLIRAGTRINWNGVIKKASVDLWDTAESNPNNAPTLWEELPYKDGYRMIPEIITVTTAFAINECGWWKGALYRSKVAGNVYNPDQFLANWEKM